MFDCKSYNIEDFEIVHEAGDSFQVHYVLRMEVEHAKNQDLAGTFILQLHGTVQMKSGKSFSTWIKE